MNSSVFVFVVLTALCYAGPPCPLIFKDCGSKGSKVTAVAFNGTCNPDQSALLKKGTTVELQISLNSDEDSKQLTSVVHGIIGGLPVPFPLGDPNACQGCNLTCPIQKGKQYTYSPTIQVKESYPSIRVVVKWEVQDENKNDLFCITIPVQISG